MLDKIQKDITEEDIDKLFNNNDCSVLSIDKKSSNIEVPQELNINKKSNRIKRPKNTETERKRIKKENESIKKDIENKIENNITEVKQLNNFDQVKKYLKKLFQYKELERTQSINNKNIINQLKNRDIYKSTDCTFHIYQPKYAMGHIVFCSCKFCSVEKQFTLQEWDEYCIKYRKWF
jgi:beta-N-acetylglucosaminidase